MICHCDDTRRLARLTLICFPFHNHDSAAPVYEPIGCFSNRGISPRPMSLLLKDFRPDMNWNEIDSVVKRCANLAHEKKLR